MNSQHVALTLLWLCRSWGSSGGLWALWVALWYGLASADTNISPGRTCHLTLSLHKQDYGLMRCKVQHEPEIRLQKVLYVLRRWWNRTTLSLFCKGKYTRLLRNEFLTCDQHTAEDQEDELKHWLKTNLHSEGELSCDTELQSLMWLIYSTAPPPDTVTAGFSKLGISPSAFSLLVPWCREKDTGIRDISPLEFSGNTWQPEGCCD